MKKRAFPLKAGPLDHLLSVPIWIASLLWFAPMALSMTLLTLFVNPDRTDWLSRLFCRVQLILLGVKIETHCHPDVVPGQTYLFVQNHTNHFDFVVAYNATPHFKQGMELASHFRYPIYGWFMKARGTIPVDPGRDDQLDFLRARMREEIQAGHSLLAFPEASRTLDGKVGRFRKGVFRLARDLNLSVVPVAVAGPWHIMRKGSLLIKPGRKLTIHIGKPKETASLDNQQLNRLIQATRHYIAGFVDDQEDQCQKFNK